MNKEKRFFRPNSVKFRNVKKQRVLNGIEKNCFVEPFDPWCSMYKENFSKPIQKEGLKKTNKNKNGKNDIDDILSVKSLKATLGNNTKKVYNIKQQNPKFIENQILLKNGKKLNNFTTTDLKSKKVCFKNGNKTNDLERGEEELGSEKIQTKLVNYTDKETRGDTEEMKCQENRDILGESNLERSIKFINNLPSEVTKTTRLEQTNCYGQKETWVDPLDAIKNPVYSRVVCDPHNSDFIIKNLQTLLGQKNEYFPLIGGKCLCGDCICGKCKCVHFKYKPIKKNDNMKTIYQQDFIKFDMDKPKPLKTPPELYLFPFKKNLSTQYGAHFKKPDTIKDNFDLINKAKLDNIEPFRNSLRAPCTKNTKYQLDYPDWGVSCNPELIPPFNPKSMIKIPFHGKNSNADYGNFYKLNEVPKPIKQINQDSNTNPLGPNIPINYNTNYQKDYIKFPNELLEPIQKKIPQDNLFLNNEKFQNQFKTAQRDHDGRQGNLICPVQIEVLRVKEIIRNFARSRKIPY